MPWLLSWPSLYIDYVGKIFSCLSYLKLPVPSQFYETMVNANIFSLNESSAIGVNSRHIPISRIPIGLCKVIKCCGSIPVLSWLYCVNPVLICPQHALREANPNVNAWGSLSPVSCRLTKHGALGYQKLLFNSTRPGQNGRKFADDIFRFIFLNGFFSMLLTQISLQANVTFIKILWVWCCIGGWWSTKTRLSLG